MTNEEKFIEVFKQAPRIEQCPFDGYCSGCRYKTDKPSISKYYDEIKSSVCIYKFWSAEYIV